MSTNKRMRTHAVMCDVLSDLDLVAHILAGNISPSAFVAACLVSKGWLSVCRADERVLRGASQYQGGLTKGTLIRLFAISSHAADALPRTSHKRYGGGTYFLYREAAINALLANGGMKEWKRRLRSRTETPCITHWAKGHDSTPRCVFQQEERLHARAMYCGVGWRGWKVDQGGVGGGGGPSSSVV